MALFADSFSHHGFTHRTGAAHESHYAIASQASDDGGSPHTGTSSLVTSMDLSAAWEPLGASIAYPHGLCLSNAEIDVEATDDSDRLSTSPMSNTYSERDNASQGTYGSLGGYFAGQDQTSHARSFPAATSPSVELAHANSGLAPHLFSTLARSLNALQVAANSM